MRAAARRDEAGVATVVTVSLGGLVLVVGFAAAGLAAIVSTHRQVQAAADLAALAAAERLVGGDACAAGRRVATDNHVRVESCRVTGRTVLVEVGRDLPDLLGGREVRARSRAGPVSPPR